MLLILISSISSFNVGFIFLLIFLCERAFLLALATRQYPRRAMFEAVLLQALIDGTGNSAVKAADLLRVIMESVTGETLVRKMQRRGGRTAPLF